MFCFPAVESLYLRAGVFLPLEIMTGYANNLHSSIVIVH